MRISVVGAGYVGLVTGACLAKLGNHVTLIDGDGQKIEAINRHLSPIHEDGLSEILQQVDITATSNYGSIANAGLVLICVGTPVNEDGSMCLDDITRAARRIAEVLREKDSYCVVAVKSTVIPGTTDRLVIPELERHGKKAGKHFGVCMSPEFLREGKAIYDFMNPMRLVVGERDKRSGDGLLDAYRDFKAPVFRTDLRTAEMIKVACNAFLATKISFINEIGNICKGLGVDTFKVAQGMGMDQRIGAQFLNAGIGFGGSCLPKDLRALIAAAKQLDYRPGVLEEVRDLNENQALVPLQLLRKHITLKGATVGLLGLAFKPGTDDVRDSRAIALTRALLDEGAIVQAYDPLATENFRKLFPQINYVTKEQALKCGATIIVTEWPEFESLDYRGCIVIDGRRVLKAREARIYEGVCW